MGLAFIYMALPTCSVVYVQKSDFHLINVFCVVIVTDTLQSVHILLETPICWESTMQSDALSLWEICSLPEIKNKSFSRIRLNDIRERMQEQNQKCKLTLSTQKREKTRPKRSLNKNVIVISVIAQRCEILCTVLGRWTSKLHTPLTLTNEIEIILRSWVNAP